MATLSLGLSCNHPLNTWSPKTNPKRSSKCMLTSFLQRFTLSSGFPFSAPCLTTDLPRTPPRPIPFFYVCKPLNPASLHPIPDPEAEHLSHDCVQTLDMTLNPFEHITRSAPYWPQSPILVHRWQCPETSPIWGWIHYSSGTAQQSYPLSPHQVSHIPSSHILTIGWTDSFYTSLDPSQRPTLVSANSRR